MKRFNAKCAKHEKTWLESWIVLETMFEMAWKSYNAWKDKIVMHFSYKRQIIWLAWNWLVTHK